MRSFLVSLLAFAGVGLVSAQDPAEGWMGYAAGTNPTGGRIMHMEAKWKVGARPVSSSAFFSPWFGVESADNLNLIQPVNPWEGSSWSMYNEYFQWSPENNKNSASHSVKPGDVLLGQVSYNASLSAYTMIHSNLNDGWSVTTNIPIQKDKTGAPKIFNIAYFVYEKVWECNLYPADGIVTFYDIAIQWEKNSQPTSWRTAYVDDNCNNRANIVDSKTISITWDTKGKSSAKVNVLGTVTGLHSTIMDAKKADVIVSTDSDLGTCPSGQTSCAYLPGQTQCCLAGENCIKNVGCRC